MSNIGGFIWAGLAGRQMDQRIVRADHQLDELIRDVLARMKAMEANA
ncbi:hypothetical protein SDC9_200428 [bioreactor metagenome]|uniref:Uncharacterized protein n=1 Tax=bioreactor metagenome TaxID=1076179 RepID=A0A645IN43_9ZZZZ